MSGAGWAQLAAVAAVLAVVVPLLGRYLAAVHGPGPAPGDRVFGPAERLIFRLLGVDPSSSQQWQSYARSVVAFGVVSVLGLYGPARK